MRCMRLHTLLFCYFVLNLTVISAQLLFVREYTIYLNYSWSVSSLIVYASSTQLFLSFYDYYRREARNRLKMDRMLSIEIDNFSWDIALLIWTVHTSDQRWLIGYVWDKFTNSISQLYDQLCHHNLLFRCKVYQLLCLDLSAVHRVDRLLVSLNHVGCSLKTWVGI
jgi:hypothetical protein